MLKKKILVIDDEKSIRDMLINTLALNGYQVETAADGQLGFEKAVTDDFDLVLMDIKMPNWNGLDAIGSLEIVKPNLKIIVISGYIQEFESQKIDLAPNIIKLIKKPFLIKYILEEIKKGIEKNTLEN